MTDGSRAVGVDSVIGACGIDDGADDAGIRGVEAFEVIDGN